jgi:hypothetical protein
VSLAARNSDSAVLNETVGCTRIYRATIAPARKNTTPEIEGQCRTSIFQSASLYPYSIYKLYLGMCSSIRYVGLRVKRRVIYYWAPSQWLWTSACKPIITRSGKILENAKYSIIINYSWIGRKLTEFDDRVRQFWARRDHGPNKFPNGGMVSEVSAVEVSILAREALHNPKLGQTHWMYSLVVTWECHSNHVSTGLVDVNAIEMFHCV